MASLPSVYVVQCSQGEFGGMDWSMQQVTTQAHDVAAKLFFVAHHQVKSSLPWPDVVIGAWVIQHGTVSGFIDLRPFLSLEFQGRRWTLDVLQGADTDVLDELDDGWVPIFAVDREGIAAALPSLSPPLMQASGKLEFLGTPEDEWLASSVGASYGRGPLDEG
jgi:hypothetical protein